MVARFVKRSILRIFDVLGYALLKKSEVPWLAASESLAPDQATSSGNLSEAAPPAASDLAIVAKARDNLTNAINTPSDTELPPYGSRWQPQADRIRLAINEFKTPEECLHYAQTVITFDHRESGGFVTDQARIKLYDDLVRNEFPWFADELGNMAENPLSYPESLVSLDGRAVSNVMFLHGRFVLFCLTHVDGLSSIVEIGGGYGAPARLWLNNTINPISSYAIIDIPECLFFAEVALAQEFGKDNVGYFDGTDPGTRIVLVPLCHLGAFRRSSDIIINTGSMQEMTDDWIDYYNNWLSYQDTRYFYSLNYAAQPISAMAESRNLWSPRPGPDWSTRLLNINMPLIRTQGPTNDFLEALFEKTPATDSLKSWSVRRGHTMSRETYVEGLDLLRQNLNQEDALFFVNTVIERLRYVPKEVLWLVDWLEEKDCAEIAPLRQKLSDMIGGYVNPDP